MTKTLEVKITIQHQEGCTDHDREALIRSLSESTIGKKLGVTAVQFLESSEPEYSHIGNLHFESKQFLKDGVCRYMLMPSRHEFGFGKLQALITTYYSGSELFVCGSHPDSSNEAHLAKFSIEGGFVTARVPQQCDKRINNHNSSARIFDGLATMSN